MVQTRAQAKREQEKMKTRNSIIQTRAMKRKQEAELNKEERELEIYKQELERQKNTLSSRGFVNEARRQMGATEEDEEFIKRLIKNRGNEYSRQMVIMPNYVWQVDLQFWNPNYGINDTAALYLMVLIDVVSKRFE